MRMLATTIGASTMAAYRYYDSKETLFAELREELFDEFGRALHASLTTARTPRERFRAACLAYCAYAEAAPEDYPLIFDVWGSPEHARGAGT